MLNHAKGDFATTSATKADDSPQARAGDEAERAVASVEAKTRSLSKRGRVEAADFGTNIAGMGTRTGKAARIGACFLATGNSAVKHAIRDSRMDGGNDIDG